MIRNIYGDIPVNLKVELFEDILKRKGFRLERIVSHGNITPDGEWYDQENDEWVILLSGEAKLKFLDETFARSLTPGDYLLIPSHKKHRVEWTHPAKETVWLALHFKEAATGL